MQSQDKGLVSTLDTALEYNKYESYASQSQTWSINYVLENLWALWSSHCLLAPCQPTDCIKPLSKDPQCLDCDRQSPPTSPFHHKDKTNAQVSGSTWNCLLPSIVYYFILYFVADSVTHIRIVETIWQSLLARVQTYSIVTLPRSSLVPMMPCT